MGLNPKRFMVVKVAREHYALGLYGGEKYLEGPMLEEEATLKASQLAEAEHACLVVEIQMIYEMKTVQRFP